MKPDTGGKTAQLQRTRNTVQRGPRMELEQPRAGKDQTKEKELGRHGCRGKSRLGSDVGSRGQQFRVDRKENAIHSGLRVHHFSGITPVWIKPPLKS